MYILILNVSLESSFIMAPKGFGSSVGRELEPTDHKFHKFYTNLYKIWAPLYQAEHDSDMTVVFSRAVTNNLGNRLHHF